MRCVCPCRNQSAFTSFSLTPVVPVNAMLITANPSMHQADHEVGVMKGQKKPPVQSKFNTVEPRWKISVYHIFGKDSMERKKYVSNSLRKNISGKKG
ncbi:hypothetical protein AVEN_124038-1 [Araneus ventricosus]|uniref:Uncharacterized protein n=1 Tax=Araneus ventricosus TaxID=182803 RepID=A0A4Y2PW82_ARAVE|nr:hypothetical protein AVEN_124038-1 [Araneus ventricosus]